MYLLRSGSLTAGLLVTSLLALWSVGRVHLSPPPQARREDPAKLLAFHRATLLQRGINLSGWLSGTDDFSAEHFRRQITGADLRFIHDVGLQYVRLGVDPAQILPGGAGTEGNPVALAQVDHAVDEAIDAGLVVMISVFPKLDYKKRLSTDRGARDFTALWRVLAKHFAGRDPERLLFELANEPAVHDARSWDLLQATVVQAIRETDREHTLVACGAWYSEVHELLKTTPLPDGNVIYAFHWYEPFVFTHQGATWGSVDWPQYHDVPFPVRSEDVPALMGSVHDATARWNLRQYARGDWAHGGVRTRLTYPRLWADRHHVPIICDEFGVDRDTAPPLSRERYLREVTGTLRDLGIGWAMWDYDGSFGIAHHSPNGGPPQPDEPTLAALGLKPPQQILANAAVHP